MSFLSVFSTVLSADNGILISKQPILIPIPTCEAGLAHWWWVAAGRSRPVDGDHQQEKVTHELQQQQKQPKIFYKTLTCWLGDLADRLWWQSYLGQFSSWRGPKRQEQETTTLSWAQTHIKVLSCSAGIKGRHVDAHCLIQCVGSMRRCFTVGNLHIVIKRKHWQAFGSRYCGSQPASWTATQRHSSIPVWCLDGITDTPLCHVCHPICSQTPTQRTEKAPKISGIQTCPMLRPYHSWHANLNSMILQYWIQQFFHCVKWARVWRTSHARARQHQQVARSCRRAKHNGLFQWGSKTHCRTIWTLL